MPIDYNKEEDGVIGRTPLHGTSPGDEHMERLCNALELRNTHRKPFSSTTAVGLGGFVLCTTPLSMVLLQWQGATGTGAANLGSWLWQGGIVTILGAVGDWIAGNTFPAIVFSLFGGFWCAFATTMIPSAGAFSVYSSDSSNTALGLQSPAFLSSLAFYFLAMALLCLIFLICSLRINVAFVMAFATLIPSLCCLAASYWYAADADLPSSTITQHAGAALLLVTSFIGWYIVLHLTLVTVDFPYLPPLAQFTFNPVIDDTFVQNKPLRLFQTGHFVDVLMTVGDGTDNGTLFAANAGSPEEVSEFIQANISSLTEVTVICPGLTISSTSSLALMLAGYGVLHAFDTDIIFGPNAGPMAGLLGIVENGFVFSSLSGGNANVVPIMMNFAISFVRTQNSSTYKSVFAPNWQTYNKNEGKQRIVVRNSGVTYEDVSAAQQTRCAFWTDIIANSFAE
ncbi:alpha/beta-hydrolase [Aureobasidium pullulans]|uniref:Alpha/beta-hydrolase n=1 Tax=Aureobasidium pullulans TaxID=5580 RepID=A0A4S9D4Z5_AURPU|nr:alpha/beta-hydrolase [Aureobasidium pullulans]